MSENAPTTTKPVTQGVLGCWMVLVFDPQSYEMNDTPTCHNERYQYRCSTCLLQRQQDHTALDCSKVSECTGPKDSPTDANAGFLEFVFCVGDDFMHRNEQVKLCEMSKLSCARQPQSSGKGGSNTANNVGLDRQGLPRVRTAYYISCQVMRVE